MSQQPQNSRALTQYLLGALPEAEAERLDELSITDHEFAEALNVAEKELVDAYVQGELNGLALEQFKSYYMTSPLRREKVRFAEAFQSLAQRSASAPAATIDPAGRDVKQSRAGLSSVLNSFIPRFAWQWGIGALAVILLVAGAWLLFENVRLRQTASQAQARHDELLQRERELQKEIDVERSANSAAEQELARLRSERERLEQELEKTKSARGASSPDEGSVVSLNLAPPMRGVGQIPALSIPPGTGVVSMQLQLEPNDFAAYRVALLNQSNNQTLWRSGKLKANTARAGKVLNVSFGAGLLKSQTTYVLRVTGIAAGTNEVIGDYSFRTGK